MIDDSQNPLLICCRQLWMGHVIVALRVVVLDVHHITFINIEIHLPVVYPRNKFIDNFLQFRYVIWVSSSGKVWHHLQI